MLLSGALYLGVSWWLKVRPAREMLGMVLDRIRR
jgi:hypothetical protein